MTSSYWTKFRSFSSKSSYLPKFAILAYHAYSPGIFWQKIRRIGFYFPMLYPLLLTHPPAPACAGGGGESVTPPPSLLSGVITWTKLQLWIFLFHRADFYNVYILSTKYIINYSVHRSVQSSLECILAWTMYIVQCKLYSVHTLLTANVKIFPPEFFLLFLYFTFLFFFSLLQGDLLEHLFN